MKNLLACVIWVSFLSGSYAFELDLRQKTPINSAIRSAIFPGWGQCFNNQKTKGYILMGSEVVALGATILLYNQAQATYKKYEEKGLRDDPLYDEYSRQMDWAHFFAYTSVAIWVYAIVDAYLVCRAQLRSRTSSIFRNIDFSFNNNKTIFKYKISF